MWRAILLAVALTAPAARAATQDTTPAPPSHAATAHPATTQPTTTHADTHAHTAKHEHKPAHPTASAAHPAHTAAKPAVPLPAAAAPAPAPVAAAPAKPPQDPNKGTVTGLPIPRFVSLRTDDVNLRSGPGTRYPIEWVYRRRDLPVEIEREFEVWRLIQDQDGVKGWVHQATLAGRRGFVVKGAERVLHTAATDDSPPVARLKPGV